MSEVSDIDERLLSMALRDGDAAAWQTFEAQVVARLEREPARSRSTWTAAAWLLAAAGVVAAASLFGRPAGLPNAAPAPSDARAMPGALDPSEETGQDPSQEPSQDPAPASEATAVTDAQIPRVAFAVPEQRADDALLALAKEWRLTLVVGPLDTKVRYQAERATPLQALEALCAAAGVHLEQFGAVFAVVAGARPAPTLTLQRPATPAPRLLAELAEELGLDLVIDASLTRAVSIDVRECPGRDLLARVAQAADAEVRGYGSVLTVADPGAPAPRTAYNIRRTDLARTVATIVKLSGTALRATDPLEGVVSVQGGNAADDVLRAIARVSGYAVERSAGEMVWRPRRAATATGPASQPPRPPSVRAATAIERALAVACAPRTCADASSAKGSAWVAVRAAPSRDQLDALAALGGGRMLERDDGNWAFVRRE